MHVHVHVHGFLGFLSFPFCLFASVLYTYNVHMYMYNMFMHISVAAVVSEPLSGSSGKSSPGSSPGSTPGEEVATSPTHLQLQHPTVQDLPAGTCTCAPVHVYMLRIIHIHIYMYILCCHGNDGFNTFVYTLYTSAKFNIAYNV